MKVEETSVSGLSSGAFMAVQFHVSFSSIIRGAGITAGGGASASSSFESVPMPRAGPFYCAEASLIYATLRCVSTPSLIPVDQLVALTKFDAVYGYIDSTSYMSNSRVFLISGTKDTVVVQG